jgi:hypothetical protein
VGTSTGKNGGARGTIYRGQGDHQRGAGGSKGCHQWRPSTCALWELKRTGRRHSLEGNGRGGLAALIPVRRRWPEVLGQWRVAEILCGGGGSSERSRQRRRLLVFTLLRRGNGNRVLVGLRLGSKARMGHEG